MAVLTIPAQNKSLTNSDEIRSFLADFGIWYENMASSLTRLDSEASRQEADILETLAPEIEKLKERGSFVTADLIDLHPDTQGLDEMLAKFSKEHTHSEDEVRFCISGRGIFHINPQDSDVFCIELEAGDLINVPAGTRHWFNLCREKTMRVIRLFQDKTGWTPYYADDRIDEQYEPLCFSEAKSSTTKQESVVKP